MNFLITYFLPSIFGLKLYLHFNKEESKFNLLINYLLLVLFSNLFCSLSFLKKDILNLVILIENDLTFSIKYIFIVLFINVILAFILAIIKKYLIISIEVEYENKTKTKNKNI